MALQRLAGSRIREKRLDRGMRQAVLAETVGISPSYLNLIEHNKRRIGGKLLSDLARALGVETAFLTAGADHDMLDQLRGAAALSAAEVELARAEEMAARYPGWSALIVAQARRIAMLQDQTQVLNDRMSYDPQLAGALHTVISAATAIRSSAAILVGPEKLDDDWQRRFHANIHNDSLRLAASSEALIAYLEAPEAAQDQIGSPFEQVEAYLAQSGFHLAALENNRADVAAVVADAPFSGAAAIVMHGFATQYHHDAVLLPIVPFQKACRKHGYDPASLAQALGVPFATVLRRLATLPPDQGHPPIGIAHCDAAGTLTLVKTVPGFSIPRFGGSCPLWPLFSALGRPAQPLRVDVALPGASPTRFRCFAIATQFAATTFDVPPAVQSTMIVMPDAPDTGAPALPVGVSCRICPRADCASRREPAMHGLEL